jgi:hypothetical protein
MVADIAKRAAEAGSPLSVYVLDVAAWRAIEQEQLIPGAHLITNL